MELGLIIIVFVSVIMFLFCAFAGYGRSKNNTSENLCKVFKLKLINLIYFLFILVVTVIFLLAIISNNIVVLKNQSEIVVNTLGAEVCELNGLEYDYVKKIDNKLYVTCLFDNGRIFEQTQYVFPTVQK